VSEDPYTDPTTYHRSEDRTLFRAAEDDLPVIGRNLEWAEHPELHVATVARSLMPGTQLAEPHAATFHPPG